MQEDLNELFYYVDAEGFYQGAFDRPQKDLMRVPDAPSRSDAKRVGEEWVAAVGDVSMLRREAYEEDGLTTEALVVALWENSPAVITALEDRRQAIKTRLPKN